MNTGSINGVPELERTKFVLSLAVDSMLRRALYLTNHEGEASGFYGGGLEEWGGTVHEILAAATEAVSLHSALRLPDSEAQ